MYLVALCDDELTELEKTEKLLDDYEKKHLGLNFVIRCFKHADELLCAVEKENYMPDVIFMDIYMPDKEKELCPLGVDVAKELRDMGYKGKIVFLTTSREYALEAFDVDAQQYIVKPVSEDRVFVLLDGLLKDMDEERRKFILLKMEGKHVRVALNDIVYCEAQGKKQCLYLVDGTNYLLRMTMTELCEQLLYYQEFVKIGASFIVNLEYIDSLNTKEVYMGNGRKIFLPRGAFKGLREQYFSYYCREKE